MPSIIDLDIPGYDILEAIGRGGMASVYRARQHTFDRNVAVKILKPDLSEDDAFCQRFVMESHIVAKLNHSNIVQVYDVGEVSNHYYLAMEFLSGGDLHKRLKKGLSVEEAVSIIRQMASALDFAHKKNIIHRDLKPDNVMFREDGAAVLTDFGIAKETNADIHLTQTGLIVGTPKYMAPEQIRGADPSPQGDIYSLGIMFYQLLCNRVPFQGGDLVQTAYQHFNDPVPQLPPHLQQYQSLIEHMMAKTIEERMPCGKDVVKALDDIVKQHPFSEKNDETVLLKREIQGSEDDETVVSQSNVETELFNKSDKTTVRAKSESAANTAAPTQAKSLPNTATVASAKLEASATSEPRASTSSSSHESSKQTQQNTVIKYGSIAAAALTVIVVGFALTDSTPEPNTTTIKAPVKALVSTADSEDIKQLLLGAITDIENDRLSTGTSNALSKYEQVLILAPGHPQAVAGKEKIAKRYLTLARRAIERKNFKTAQNQINSAIDINETLDISAIQLTLDAAKRDQSSPISTLKRVQISGLLENAKLFEKEGKLNSPAGENAVENYRKILGIDPYHAEAKQRLAEITSK
ncbi:MAG: serine/threonine protein kinase [Agarilytica sp.]